MCCPLLNELWMTFLQFTKKFWNGHPFCNLLKKTKANWPNSSSTNFLDKINSLSSVYIPHGFLTRISKPTQVHNMHFREFQMLDFQKYLMIRVVFLLISWVIYILLAQAYITVCFVPLLFLVFGMLTIGCNSEITAQIKNCYLSTPIKI